MIFQKENIKNVIVPAVIFLVLAVVITFLMGIYFKSYTIPKDGMQHWQDIGNYLSATVAIAVGFAGSLVAIVLAILALKQADSTNSLTEKIAKDEKLNALKDRITQKVTTTVKNNHDIISAYYDVSYNMYEYVAWLFMAKNKTSNLYILETAIKSTRNYVHLNPHEEEVLKTSDTYLSSIRKSLDFFSVAIATLEHDLFTRQVYQNKYLISKLPLRDVGKIPDNFYIDIKKEIAYFRLQIKKFASRYASSDDVLSIVNLLLQNYDWINSNEKLQKDYFTSIVLGYCIAPLNKDGDTLLLGGVLFYEILLNLPNDQDLKEVLVALEVINKEADEQEEISKYIVQTVDNLFSNNQNYFDGFRVNMTKQAELIQNNFIHHIQFQKFDSKHLLYIAKALAIRDGVSIITMDIIEEASHYVVFDDEDNLRKKYNLILKHGKKEMDYVEVEKASQSPIINNDPDVKLLYQSMMKNNDVRLRHYWNYDFIDLNAKSRWI